MLQDQQILATFICNTAPVGRQKALDIAAQFHEKDMEKGAYFLKEGRPCNEYLFLTEGFMRSFAFDVQGKDISTGFYTAQQVVFEVSAFFNRTISRENIQALTPCRGLALTYEELNGLFHSLPEFREFGRAILVKGFASLKARMLSAITATAEERYLMLLQSNPEILQHVPLKMIATYLGITDTSLSRIRKELNRK